MGNYRQVACNECNLNYRYKLCNMKIPVFVHNLQNYDTHFLMQHVKKEYGEIKVIPNNIEKYISYEIGNLVFKN